MLEVFYFDKVVKKGDLKDFETFENKKIWIDAVNITSEEAAILRDKFNLHPLTMEDLIHEKSRIKIEEFNDYIFCVFYGIKKEKPLDLVELDFVVGKNFIITNHNKRISTFYDLKRNDEKMNNLFQKGTEFIFHYILDKEVSDFFPVLEEIDNQIEEIEEDITKKAKPESLQKILNTKRKIILIKKFALSQREKISFLTKNNYKVLSKKVIPYFRDVYDHAIRVSDSIDNYREAIGGTFDAYMSAVSNNTNEVMKTLSIIATIALPLGVISGIYGTNFAVLPGQNLSYGFWIMLGIMFSIIGFMMFIFKRRKWF
jgi:magnesium transporter